MDENVTHGDQLADLLHQVDGGGWTTEVVFAKALTGNDDSGRHGVLVPAEAYALFPPLGAAVEAGEWNPSQPITTWWPSGESWTAKASKFTHYSRYPERRVTSLDPSLVNVTGPRVIILAKRHGAFEYRCLVKTPSSPGWSDALRLFDAPTVPPPGTFQVLAPGVGSGRSPVLDQLLGELRAISGKGWVRTIRAGDTGVGMTLEHLLGLPASARPTPDYHGIELKAKRIRGGGGRRTLFAKTPQWGAYGSRGGLLDVHGAPDKNGRVSIYQSIYMHRQSKEGWQLVYDADDEALWVTRLGSKVVWWELATLAASLSAKHRETVFVYAETRGKDMHEEFRFATALHALDAGVERYLAVLADGKGCVDFAIHRRDDGTVRDHGFLFRADDSALPAVFRQVRDYELSAGP